LQKQGESISIQIKCNPAFVRMTIQYSTFLKKSRLISRILNNILKQSTNIQM